MVNTEDGRALPKMLKRSRATIGDGPRRPAATLPSLWIQN